MEEAEGQEAGEPEHCPHGIVTVSLTNLIL